MKTAAYADYLIQWLENQRTELYGMDGYTLGVSGGIDSAVCAHLAARTGAPVQALILPAEVTSPSDVADAQATLESAGIDGQIISIAPWYDLIMQQLSPVLNSEPERVNVLKGNLMARLRMIALFTTAQSHRSIVLGTDNAAEWLTGYFTKFGDGAADVLPLAGLRKEQVFELGRYLGVPQSVLDKKPSAGLWAGQTDEAEMGVTYAEIDAYLRGETVSPQALQQIRFWHNRSHHKRMLPPKPKSPDEAEC
ncbi:NAD(+) synthase [[Mannheimia] succiniciproducens]|uniref:NH(3)-dependent NAD(+) synthetase n=1 Tax=Mannheimia succiniciproducens (strain KCTC 0769BP / MBEL55E) TaxID=221988 RepID=NADE_MANSM|nr:NAD(+) synthase [[Mannheimia] succiniciproducens]Q65RB5.1 RecName: Full=NH(3)-dependent NAD(+) synthetase [[Mannheimia] succiniciproducens MBEL55E]AAU38495.1 NadE protein [[Mannheimia] succiniciproducens MBEL55E]